jgi:hypothetical protein
MRLCKQTSSKVNLYILVIAFKTDLIIQQTTIFKKYD